MGKRMVADNSYLVIVLEINLPHINGFELCRFIKREFLRQPVLLLTALAILPDKESGFGAGADDYRYTGETDSSWLALVLRGERVSC